MRINQSQETFVWGCFSRHYTSIAVCFCMEYKIYGVHFIWVSGATIWCGIFFSLEPLGGEKCLYLWSKIEENDFPCKIEENGFPSFTVQVFFLQEHYWFSLSLVHFGGSAILKPVSTVINYQFRIIFRLVSKFL